MEEDAIAEPDSPFGWRCRLWCAKVSPERGERYRLEVELPEETHPGGGVDTSAQDGRIVGPCGTGSVVRNRIGGGPTEEDPVWMSAARDSLWATYLFDSPARSLFRPVS